MNYTVEEFNKQLTAFEKDIIKKLPDQFIHATAGFDVAGLVKERVIQTSKSGDNTHFSPYSTKPMLTSGTTAKSKRVWNEKAGSKNKRSDLKWVTLKKGGKNVHLFELSGGYAELRRLEGFSNRFKNFWFTTEMWKKFGMIASMCTATGFKLRFGGKTPEAQKKIDANSAREGKNILEMTKGEVADVSDNVSTWMDEMLRKHKI